MLDSQAPDVQVVADADNDVNNKASVDTKCQTKAGEHEGNLVDAITQSAGPSETDACLENGTQSVDDAEEQRECEHVLVRELRLCQVCGDHLADGVGVHETNQQDEGNEVLVQDLRVKGEVSNDESPGAEERSQAQKRIIGSVATVTARLEDVADALDGVVGKNQATVKYVEVTKVHGVSSLGQRLNVWQSESRKHGLLPVATATFDSGDSVDDAEGQNAFDRARNKSQSEGVSVVLIPGLNVESQKSCEKSQQKVVEQALGLQHTAKQHKHSLPSLAEVHSSREKQHFQAGVQRVNTVIEELAERTGLACAAPVKHLRSARTHQVLQEAQNSRLSTIHSVESLIQEETNSPRPVHPNRAILVHVRGVVKHSRDVRDHEAKARERDLRPHGQ